MDGDELRRHLLPTVDEISVEIKILQSFLGSLPQWKTFVLLENVFPAFYTCPYDALREAFRGSRGFRTSSGLCGFAFDSVQEGDSVVRIIGMQTLMIIRPVEDGSFRLISPADIQYDMLLQETQEMWIEGGEWVTIS